LLPPLAGLDLHDRSGRAHGEGKENEKEMSEAIVRCPYCVLGSEFRPMFRRSSRRFICLCCGHAAQPEEPYAKCSCAKCREMIRIASRCRSLEELRKRLAADLPYSS